MRRAAVKARQPIAEQLATPTELSTLATSEPVIPHNGARAPVPATQPDVMVRGTANEPLEFFDPGFEQLVICGRKIQGGTDRRHFG